VIQRVSGLSFGFAAFAAAVFAADEGATKMLCSQVKSSMVLFFLQFKQARRD
jgi:hypothetical protein